MAKPPLSPHLQIYQLPMNALMSITHRITGVILSLAFLCCIVALVFLAMGEKSFASVDPLLNSWAVVLLLNAGVFILIYHLLNGVRHLMMDKLMGLSKKGSFQSGIAVLVLTVLIFILWLLIL